MFILRMLCLNNLESCLRYTSEKNLQGLISRWWSRNFCNRGRQKEGLLDFLSAKSWPFAKERSLLRLSTLSF